MKNFNILYLTFVIALTVHSKEIRSRNLVVPAGRTEGRITGGQNATDKQFPYQVGLQVQDRNSATFWCGGALLNNEWILTAAHCTEDVIKVRVLLGNIDRSDDAYQYNVTKENIIMHEGYDSENDLNDISLIKIPFTNYTDKIQPIKLPAVGDSHPDYEGEKVIVSGWGRIGDLPTDRTKKLQWTILNIIPNKLCYATFDNVNFSKNICTASIDGKNICDGDSGGPLVLEADKLLIGIVAFSSESCLDGNPAVYTRVSGFLEWIKKFTDISY